EGERALLGVAADADGLAGLELAPQDLLAEQVLEVLLDRPPQGAGAEVRVVTLLDQEVLGRVLELELEAAGLEPLADFLELVLDDIEQVVAVERAADDYVVQPVKELGAEVALELAVERLLHLLVVLVLVGPAEAEAGALVLDHVRADVAGQ